MRYITRREFVKRLLAVEAIQSERRPLPVRIVYPDGVVKQFRKGYRESR